VGFGACLILIGLALNLCAAAAHAQDGAACRDALHRLDEAITARDRSALETEGFEIGDLPGCDPDEVRPRRRATARILAEMAQDASLAGAEEKELQARYAAARRVAAVWSVLRGLADLAYARRTWDEAAPLYNDELVAIEDPTPDDLPLPPGVALLAYQRAAETQMLASLLAVPLSPMRDGTPGGLDAVLAPGGPRDLVALPRPLPITFVFDSAEMTSDGLLFAERWWQQLRGSVASALVLAGHTDPRGSDVYNDSLSLRRSATMASFLRKRGFSGRLTVVGLGRRCPVSFSTGSSYTQEEQLQILRRVEVITAEAVPAGYCGGTKPTMPP
jgi:outer membrane protein OmpA-like peptidoglycan-associated protein